MPLDLCSNQQAPPWDRRRQPRPLLSPSLQKWCSPGQNRLCSLRQSSRQQRNLILPPQQLLAPVSIWRAAERRSATVLRYLRSQLRKVRSRNLFSKRGPLWSLNPPANRQALLMPSRTSVPANCRLRRRQAKRSISQRLIFRAKLLLSQSLQRRSIHSASGFSLRPGAMLRPCVLIGGGLPAARLNCLVISNRMSRRGGKRTVY